MSPNDKLQMKNTVKSMFNFAFDSYMVSFALLYYFLKKYAYPADELMPLSCSGRYRGSQPSRGDIDDSIGNFSLTLIDSLDSLFIFGEFDKFESSIEKALNLTFDTDVVVSVFETNIRVLGGLIGGHVSALALKNKLTDRLHWYHDQLLLKAIDIADRLLPAFDTKTGIPHSRINLKTRKTPAQDDEASTCTACAGTLILEFATLSRFTNNPIYEIKARKALDYLWKQRNQHSNLVGTVININNGNWLRKESGVGAGIDSYYEYLLKAYILLGDTTYLHRFHTHYTAIQRYMIESESLVWPFLFLNVNMHTPNQKSRNYMDALSAFWPGMQVLHGDVKEAIALHEMLFQMMKKHHFLPEAFTPDMKVYWGHHLLRPEFIESTYFLYEATHDPYYLDVAKLVVENLEKYTKVPCGYSAIEDVRTMKHSDQMDSFFLAETCKYLYLIFSESKDIPISINDYIFTTEAHILPSNLAPFQKDFWSSYNKESKDVRAENFLRDHLVCPNIYQEAADSLVIDKQPVHNSSQYIIQGQTESKWCFAIKSLFNCLITTIPSSSQLFDQLWNLIDKVRKPLRTMANRLLFEENFPSLKLVETSQNNQNSVRNMANLQEQLTSLFGQINELPIQPAEIEFTNLEHLKVLRSMGITVKFGSGQVDIAQDVDKADNSLLGLQGRLLLQQIMVLQAQGKKREESEVTIRPVSILSRPSLARTVLLGGPAQFGHFPQELRGESSVSYPQRVVGTLRLANPITACKPLNKLAPAYPRKEFFPNIGLPDDDEFLEDLQEIRGGIVVVSRGDCMFIEKAINSEKAGAIGMIVIDNVPGTSTENLSLFSMSSDVVENKKLDTNIPCLFLYSKEGLALIDQMRKGWALSKKPLWVHFSSRMDTSFALSSALYFELPTNNGKNPEERMSSFTASIVQKKSNLPNKHIAPESLDPPFNLGLTRSKEFSSGQKNFSLSLFISNKLDYSMDFVTDNIEEMVFNSKSLLENLRLVLNPYLNEECGQLVDSLLYSGIYSIKTKNLNLNEGTNLLPSDWMATFNECWENLENQQVELNEVSEELVVCIRFDFQFISAPQEIVQKFSQDLVTATQPIDHIAKES